MRKNIILLSLAIVFSCVAWAQEVFVPASNKNIVYSGRVNHSNPQSPAFVYPGTSIKANFSGSSIKMKAKPGSGFFMVSIDAQEPQKICFTKTDSILTLAQGLPNSEHSVDIMLAYEGYEWKPEFRGFYLSEGGKINSLSILPSRKIEFIGNSITCGYGSEAANGKIHFTYDTENFYYTYAANTARELDAQLMVAARSGIGAYRNYNGKVDGDENTMPRWYDYTLLYDNSQKWNFRNFHPNVICVNLGTNDLSTRPYKIDLYKKNYKNFIIHLRKLQPQAKIVMITGSMLQGEPLKDQKQALDEIYKELHASGYKALYRFDFTTQDGTLGYGADYHPSIQQHRKMANELIPFIRQITGW